MITLGLVSTTTILVQNPAERDERVHEDKSQDRVTQDKLIPMVLQFTQG